MQSTYHNSKRVIVINNAYYFSGVNTDTEQVKVLAGNFDDRKVLSERTANKIVKKLSVVRPDLTYTIVDLNNIYY